MDTRLLIIILASLKRLLMARGMGASCSLLLVSALCGQGFAQVEDPELNAGQTLNEVEIRSIDVNGKRLGRAFEGIGALSAGASSRLLYDYPEPQRSDILDFLFKPNFGASLQHLKVEIGGDINSTDGSEPSHAITRDEFEHPKPEYFFRGYEWWLMKEAKKRNPDIILEGLQWGAPGWIGDGNFFSDDNAEFVSSWIRGMKTYHGLDIDYVGIRNERRWDVDYIKLLRQVLDKNGLQRVRIDAGDLWQPQEKWDIADEMVKDKELRDVVVAINAHTTAHINFYTPPSAKELNIPIWDGEGHGYGGDWYAAAEHARFNRAYIRGKITKMISWSLISSYHDYLVVPKSGPMKANTPWSGHYEVQPPIWAMAHTTQFAPVGWRYIESAGKTPELLRQGCSVTALKSPTSSDYSIIIESMDAKEPQRVRFRISSDLSSENVSVWRSVFKQEEFVRQPDVEVTNGVFELIVVPDAIYSLTTTRGQMKGMQTNPIPSKSPFPLPYTADFETETAHQPGRYWSDQHGTFEVVPNPAGEGQCLKQQMPVQGIQWRGQNHPHTVIGEMEWSDYRVSTDFLLPESGRVMLLGRAATFHGRGPFPGYGLEVGNDGQWKLTTKDEMLASGTVNLSSNEWNTMQLSFSGQKIEAMVNGKLLASIQDAAYPNGAISLGTGWNTAYFDNIRIQQIP